MFRDHVSSNRVWSNSIQSSKYCIDERIETEIAVHEIVCEEDEDEVEDLILAHGHITHEKDRSEGVVDVQESIVDVFVPPVLEGPF